ncbi:flagellar hook-length control protein FliK [Treponema bryantii]|uniref:flagellar hook-length control protein FliK n=1 Tax=Treponema bryantii TaxID=163 RepID=UPI002B2EFF29|nr:hypothetical protein TRBR_17590 [Treponema bryantii]
MSYQAITDIIVNPSQLQDLQLSNTVKDSPKQTSVSFADYLAAYNSEDVSKTETKTVQSEDQTSKISDSDKAEKTEKSEKTSENQVKNQNESEKVSEKTVEKTESDENKDNKISEKTDSKGKSVNDSETETKKSVEDKKTGKADSKDTKDSKNKKLSDKDFSRFEEIAKTAESEDNSAKLAGAVQNTIKSEENEIKLSDNEIEVSENAINTESSAQLALNNIQTEESSSDTEFDFSGNQDKTKNQFTLDKDGKITVEDQRTKEVAETDNTKKSALKTSEIKLANENTAVMSVELNPNAEADVLSLNTQTAASNGSNFQAMLSNQLQNVAPEFVKAGNLVLKDNNQGTINLVLHPDDIGNVKIHLSLDGKTLSGHITVATKEALQVFKDNSETLREAFIKSGFDAASFDVAMNNGSMANQNMGFNGQDDGRNIFAQRLYGNSAEGLSAELDDIFENAVDISNYSVNIVA